MWLSERPPEDRLVEQTSHGQDSNSKYLENVAGELTIYHIEK